jgi:hypothetical protein
MPTVDQVINQVESLQREAGGTDAEKDKVVTSLRSGNYGTIVDRMGENLTTILESENRTGEGAKTVWAEIVKYA